MSFISEFKDWLSPKPKPIRFCKDCKWQEKVGHFSGFEVCLNPRNIKPLNQTEEYLVHGMDVKKERLKIQYCSKQRDDVLYSYSKCGRDANWFEPITENK